MNSREYFRLVQNIISNCLIIVSSDLHFEEISSSVCYIKGKLELIDRSKLFFVEFIVIENKPILEKYKYHWQDENNQQIGRWDNVKHHPQLPTFPDHYHDHTNNSFPSQPMNLEKVLYEIEKNIFK